MDYDDEQKSAYMAGFRDAKDAIRAAAPRFGPEGPHNSEDYGYNEGFHAALKAVEEAQKNALDEDEPSEVAQGLIPIPDGYAEN